MNNHRSKLFALIAILIIDLLCFTCILPLFPSILDGYAKAVPEDVLYARYKSFLRYIQDLIGVPNLERYNNVFLGGVLGSLFSFLQYTSSPILGALSDRWGRKPVLIASVIGSLASYVIWSISSTFALFVFSRVIGGLSKASVSISIAIVSDLCSLADRGRGMALVGVAFSVAFVAGPSIGAYFSIIGKSGGIFNAPHFAIALTIVELVLIVLFLPETLSENSKNERISSAADFINPTSLFSFKVISTKVPAEQLRKIVSYGWIYFFYLFIFSALEFTLTFYTHLKFQYTGMQQGRMYFFVGLLMILTQGGFVRRIRPEKHHIMVRFGLLAIIPGYLIIALADRQSVFFIGLMLYSIASAVVVPCLTTLVSQLSPEETKGATMGVFRSLGALSRACGPAFGSLVFWLLGPSYCYALGAVAFALPLFLLKRMQAVSKQDLKVE